MDKKVAGYVKDFMEKGEHISPVDHIKLNVKFQKPSDGKKKIIKTALKKSMKE